MINIVQLVGGIPILIYLDRVGRRTLAIAGGLAMAIPHLIMCGMMNKFSSDWPSHRGIAWFCVALICTSILSLPPSL